MIELPQQNWQQANTSDKYGSVVVTKNINFDENGYLKLSPRTVNMFDDSGSVANISDTDFDTPTAYGLSDSISSLIVTTDEPFNLSISGTTKTIAEDSSSSNPNLNTESHGVWFQNKFLESTATAVYENNNGTWTASVITGLTSGKYHCMAVFKNAITLAVANGNEVRLYGTSYSIVQFGGANFTIPTDFEVCGMAYNNELMGVITRPSDSSLVTNSEAYFYTWTGNAASGTPYGVGSKACLAIAPYRATYVILTDNGRLLEFNGGGFKELATFPFYVDLQSYSGAVRGDILTVEGEIIKINLGIQLTGKDKKQQTYSSKNPSGVWCYDPKIGLYHRYSPSISKVYFHNIAQADVNTTTNTFTTSITIPTTGNPVVIQSAIGGLTVGTVYYVIRLTSTTFQVASTKQNAIDLIPLDITSADTNNYLYMYDICDFGQSYYGTAGAVTDVSPNNLSHTDVLIGFRGFDTSLNSLNVLAAGVPFLENRGYAITSKIYPQSVSENIPKLYVKHRVLDTNDSIIVKVKTKDYIGLPVSTPSGVSATNITWISTTQGTTTADISEAYSIFNLGEELELELTAGVGAGQLVKITNITYNTGTYTITVEEEIVGAAAGLLSYYNIDNWAVCGTVDSTTQKDGIYEVPVAKHGRAPQFKIELRGYNTTVEDVLINNKPFSAAV